MGKKHGVMRGGNVFASLEKQTCKANGVSLTWQSFMPWPDAFFNYHAEAVRNLTGNVTDILKMSIQFWRRGGPNLRNLCL